MAEGRARRSRTNSRRRTPTRADRKLQRWIDLIGALLCRHYGATFEELAREVPAYAASRDPRARERMFERDKDELRTFGIPIETRAPDDDDRVCYVLSPRELYLPYLALAVRGTAPRRSPVPSTGYRALPTLQLSPDELAAALEAADLAAALGDSELRADADSARRKLTFDLDDTWDQPDPTTAAPPPTASRATAASLHRLGEALFRRKRVAFDYCAGGQDATERRTAEPYGLFVQSGKWYLAARNIGKDGVRNFRVDRMRDIRVDLARPLTPDYDVPPSFRLGEHAAPRQPWELGDTDGIDAIVEIRGRSGAVRAAAALGQRVPGRRDCRAYHVRRIDAFARWVLSFGGDIVPVSPRAVVDAWRSAATSTLRLYARHTKRT